MFIQNLYYVIVKIQTQFLSLIQKSQSRKRSTHRPYFAEPCQVKLSAQLSKALRNSSYLQEIAQLYAYRRKKGSALLAEPCSCFAIILCLKVFNRGVLNNLVQQLKQKVIFLFV